MGLERRVVQCGMAMVNQLLGGTVVISQRAAWSVRGEKSRMKREFHVRFCEGVGVQFPCATRLMPPAVATAIPGRFGKVRSRSRIGRYEESDGCIVLRKPRTMPSNIGGGDGGGKAAGRGEGKLQRMLRTQSRNPHVPDGLHPRTGTGWATQAPNVGRV